MTRPARIPTDVNRPDKILGPFTARQVAILAGAGATLYLAWLGLRGLVPTLALVIAAIPLGAVTFVIAVGQRDGISLDRYLLAAIRHRLRPGHITTPNTATPQPAPPGTAADPGPASVPDSGPASVPDLAPTPAWLPAPPTPGPSRQRPRRSRWSGLTRSARFLLASPAGQPMGSSGLAGSVGLPIRGVASVSGGAGRDPVGVIDTGPDGLVVIAVVSTVNLTLRSPAEQDSLVDGFARYLHTLTGPAQILVRAVPLRLTDHLDALTTQAQQLPHRALADAAREHARHLARLAAHRGPHELLTRQVLLILREPTTHSRNTRCDDRPQRRRSDGHPDRWADRSEVGSVVGSGRRVWIDSGGNTGSARRDPVPRCGRATAAATPARRRSPACPPRRHRHHPDLRADHRATRRHHQPHPPHPLHRSRPPRRPSAASTPRARS